MYRLTIFSETWPIEPTASLLLHRRHAEAPFGKLLAQHLGDVPLELIGKMLRGFGRVALAEQVNLVGHHFQRLNRHLQRLRILEQQPAQFVSNFTHQNFATGYLGHQTR
ncbi:MAG TPA: hypothetical protein PKG95_12605 [Anaerolineaceae bacterium]|jgi:hypothetical protein|nr:hypothetical protein [Anaerolineaceae bacterium]